MTAEEVKEALRRRYPAKDAVVAGPGPWTCLEEFANIDLLAFAAWSNPTPKVTGINNAIVGHEVKVSRGDYRREVLNPSKRTVAVASCHAFYFVTPKGLLTKEEKAYVEPEHFKDGSAYVRVDCPERCARADRWSKQRSTKTGKTAEVPVVLGEEASWIEPQTRFVKVEGTHKVRGDFSRPMLTEPEPVVVIRHDPSAADYYPSAKLWQWIDCKTCKGLGYLAKSVVEQEAPTLWIPRDVGLIEIHGEGESTKCRVVRKAPITEKPKHRFSQSHLVRWASYRPDPRHIRSPA